MLHGVSWSLFVARRYQAALNDLVRDERSGHIRGDTLSLPLLRGSIRGFKKKRARNRMPILPTMPENEPTVEDSALPSVFGEWTKTADNTWTKEHAEGGPDKIAKFCLDLRAFEEWKLAEANDEEEPEADFCFICMGELNFVVTQSGTVRTECSMCGEEWGGDTYQLAFVSRKPPELPFQMRRFFDPVEKRAREFGGPRGKTGIPTEYVPRSWQNAKDNFLKRLFALASNPSLTGTDAFEAFVTMRWPDGIQCPYCSTGDPFFITTRKIWRCRSAVCSRQFAVTTDTVLHGSRASPEEWLHVLRLIAKERNRVSQAKVASAIGVTKKTAFRMLRILREALQLSECPEGQAMRQGA